MIVGANKESSRTVTIVECSIPVTDYYTLNAATISSELPSVNSTDAVI